MPAGVGVVVQRATGIDDGFAAQSQRNEGQWQLYREAGGRLSFRCRSGREVSRSRRWPKRCSLMNFTIGLATGAGASGSAGNTDAVGRPGWWACAALRFLCFLVFPVFAMPPFTAFFFFGNAASAALSTSAGSTSPLDMMRRIRCVGFETRVACSVPPPPAARVPRVSLHRHRDGAADCRFVVAVPASGWAGWLGSHADAERDQEQRPSARLADAHGA